MSFNSMDSQSSEGRMLQEQDSNVNASYLYGRDPSIINYGPRPLSSIDSKKNLNSLFEEQEQELSSNSVELPTSQTIRVCLRLKPFSKNIKLTEAQAEAYSILDSTTLLTKLPSSDHLTTSIINKSVNPEFICKKYTFSQTFGPETTQYDFFDQCIKSKINEFISGQNYTVMTYGTTNSGKSYTLQGTSYSPGIIPRSLEFVFANIDSRVSPSYKPYNDFNVTSLNSVEKAQEVEIKSKILSFGLNDKNQNINLYKQMQKILHDEDPSRLSQSSDAHYSVWVSFAEIYNETIFDLLSNESCQKRRTALKLATDSQGRAFIKGLKSICVSSGLEAFQILMAGQYNLKVAATALNARSSRSHCIFTIKLLKYYKENDPTAVEISTFSFCDLAGSERLKKTLNIGERLKEAQNINTSLMVFGRCLKSIYEDQTMKNRSDRVGPFRDSKLTRLFQQALSGKEQMTLIVNVNPSPNLYIETQNVLNFAAIAKKIVIQAKKSVKRRRSNSRFSLVVSQNKKNNLINWNETVELEDVKEEEVTEDEVNNDKYIEEEKYELLLEEKKKLEREVHRLKKTAMQRDIAIRTEMADTYTQMMKKMEDDFKKRLKDAEDQQEDAVEWSVHRVEQFYKEKLKEVMSKRKRKRTRSSDDDDEDDDDDDDEYDDEDDTEKNIKIEELEAENSQFKEKLKSLQLKYNEVRKEAEVSKVQKNSAEFELSLAKEDLKRIQQLVTKMEDNTPMKNGCTTSAMEEFKNQIYDLKTKNKNLQDLLNEAKKDYTDINNEVEDKEKLCRDLEGEVIVQTERVKELEEEIENLTILLDKNITESEKKDEVIDNQQQKINELSEQILKLNDDNKFKELEDQIDVLNGILDVYKKDKDLLLAKIDEQKRLLKQDDKITIDNVNYSDIDCQTSFISNSNINKLLQTSFNDCEKLLDTEKELEKVKLINEKLNSKYESMLNEKQQFIDEITVQFKTVEEINRSYINEMDVLQKKYDALKQVEETQKSNEAELEKRTNEFEEFQKEHTKIVSKLKETIKDLETKIHEFEVENLEGKISELSVNLKTTNCDLTKLKDEKNQAEEKIRMLEMERDDLKDKIHEKDKEIYHLQKEIKKSLNLNNTDELSKLEYELKKALNELNDKKELNKQLEDEIKTMNNKINDLESAVRLTDIYKKQAEDYHFEIKRIKIDNENYIQLIDEQTREMESFKKNRNETISRYEHLLKNANEEIDRHKREVTSLQRIFHQQGINTPRKNDDCVFVMPSSADRRNIEASKTLAEKVMLSSDDDTSSNYSQKSKRGRKPSRAVTPKNDEISEIAMEETNSRSIRPRKKKLFTKDQQEIIDLDPAEDSPAPTPSRKLRTRKNLK